MSLTVRDTTTSSQAQCSGRLLITEFTDPEFPIELLPFVELAISGG
jgi:hypothetical protein